MRTALIAGCVKAQQLLKAHELFDEARQDGALPAAAALGSLLEVLCGRGYGLQALDAATGDGSTTVTTMPRSAQMSVVLCVGSRKDCGNYAVTASRM